MNSGLSSFLNASRWFAAFLVVISHVRHLVFVDYNDVANKNILNKAFYFITGFGHEAVIVFFVISGFLVGGITLRKWMVDGPCLRSYLSARVSRIYTVFIPALVAGVGLDLIGLYWFNAGELYTNSAQYHTVSLNRDISAAIDIPTFIGNILMMQNIVVGTFGSNSPLWSLAYEWWYYCIFAFAGAAYTGVGKRRVVFAMLALFVAFLLPVKIVLWGGIWFVGVCAYLWVIYGMWRPHPLFALFVFFVVSFVSRISHNTDNVANPESMVISFSRDFSLAISYAFALGSAGRMDFLIRFRRFNNWLADFSYSTYLIHFPIMLFVVSVAYQVFGVGFQVQPSIMAVGGFVEIVVIAYVLCFGFSVLTEKYTNNVRNRLDLFF